MRREERVTVQGPVKKQQPDGMSHGGGGGGWRSATSRSFSRFPAFFSAAAFCACPPCVRVGAVCVSPVQRCCSWRLREVWLRHRNFPAFSHSFPQSFALGLDAPPSPYLLMLLFTDRAHLRLGPPHPPLQDQACFKTTSLPLSRLAAHCQRLLWRNK